MMQDWADIDSWKTEENINEKINAYEVKYWLTKILNNLYYLKPKLTVTDICFRICL
jgi:hypothetical protein